MKILKSIWFEILLICIYAGVISCLNKQVAILVIICLLMGMASFIIPDNLLKFIMTTIANIMIIYAGIFAVNSNEIVQEVVINIFNQYTWLIWFGCVTINNLLVSKMCLNKKFIHRMSCILGYIVSLVMSFYLSIFLCISFKIENVQDKSQEINFITALFILFYTLLQTLICTKDEILLLLFWEYELDDKNNRVVLVNCKINRRKYIIKKEYIVGNRTMETYLSSGAFTKNKKVECVIFENGIKAKEQSLIWLFGENRNLKKIVGLPKGISCNFWYRKFLPNLKSIEWTFCDSALDV